MFTQTLTTISLTLLLNSVLANAQVTAAAHLAPRQADPAFVGYISENGGYSDPRSCDYPQTVSTSGAYVQCCPTTGSCPFYTACSSNTLIAAGATVPCDVNSALTCNTGLVLSTPGANARGSYLACWQTSLGTNPFTFVQNIGSATAAGASGTGSATSTGAAASGNTARSSSSASRTSSSMSGTSSGASATASAVSSAASSAASSATKNVGNSKGEFGFGGVVGGAVMLLGQALL